MDDDWLTLSALEHHAYCPWQARLLQDGVWADNVLTVQGTAAHARVDTPGVDARRGVLVHHRVRLASQRLRVHGIADSVEVRRDGSLTPVEHKWGRGAGDLTPLIVQTTAQALCLEEMCGVVVDEVAIYIVEERQRETFATSDWRERTEDEIERARELLVRGTPERPTYHPRLCRSCSLMEACQPAQEGGE